MKLLSSRVLLAALAIMSLAPQPPLVTAETCVAACPENLKPLCGSNGVTYDNECMFEYARCTAANAGTTPALTIVSNGSCPAATSGGGSSASTCAQEFACMSKYDPVCGSDGKTYSNACELKRATCANPTVVLKSTGECPSNSNSATGSTGGSGSAIVCKIKACTKEYKPVCGSDNKTYANKCTFANAQCETPALTLKAEVACEGDDIDDSGGSSSVGRDAQVPSGSSDDDACVTMCTKEYTPVCGSNGLTYENTCLFKNAQCSNATLTKASDSACPTAAPATGSAANPMAAVGTQVAALAVLGAVASLML